VDEARPDRQKMRIPTVAALLGVFVLPLYWRCQPAAARAACRDSSDARSAGEAPRGVGRTDGTPIDVRSPRQLADEGHQGSYVRPFGRTSRRARRLGPPCGGAEHQG